MILIFLSLNVEDIFFPYGTSEGDQLLTQTADMVYRNFNNYLDLASPTIRPRTGFPLGNEFYYSLYVSHLEVDYPLTLYVTHMVGVYTLLYSL